MMRRIATIALCGALCAGLAALAAPASAAPPGRAEQLFKKGKKLLGEKKYAEACTAFEQSDQIDPQIGAKLNVALCYQEWGKLATAWRWYSDAEQLAIKAGDDRARKIRALIDELEPKVPRLTLSFPPDAAIDGVVFRLDGAELAVAALREPLRLDPGPHRIDTVVDGTPRTKVVAMERGDRTELALPVPTRGKSRSVAGGSGSGSGAGGGGAAGGGGDADDPGRTYRWLGLGTAGAGVVALVIAGIVTKNASSDYDHAIHGYCNDAVDMCDATGLARTHSARHRANIATGVAIGGLVAVAGGLALYFFAPHGAAEAAPAERASHAIHIAPSVSGDSAGLVVLGAF